MYKSIDEARQQGQIFLELSLRKATRSNPEFAEKAKALILKHLATHGPTSGEDLTDACKAAGIVPENDDRAFGGVYFSLANQTCPRIRVLRSDLPRRRGHGTTGGKLYGLVQ